MAEDTRSNVQVILDKIREQAPKDDARLHSYLSALDDSLREENKKLASLAETVTELQGAYEKLTAPANRLGTFIRWLTDDEAGGPDRHQALIIVSDSEYVCETDPKLDISKLTAGAAVRINEAYAVVNILPTSDLGRIEKTAEVFSDGRLRLGSGPEQMGGRIIERANAIKEASIAVGDDVRLDSSGRFALEVFHKSSVRDYFLEEVPELPWEKVGGQAEAIRLIRETIEQPLLHPELFKKFDKKPIKGVLLYGPPGCGKTLIGKATAYNLSREYSERLGKPVKEYFMSISGPKILNMWLGESERIVREIFATAREKAADGNLVFIFLDEAESILRSRSTGKWLNISNTIVPQFCVELDGLQSLENVVLILTSNRPDFIDPAILRPERIDRKVKVVRPDKIASAQIMGIYLHENIPLDPAVLKKYSGDADCARQDMIEAVLQEAWAPVKKNEFLKVNLRNGTSEVLYYKDMMSGALLKSVVDRAKDTAIKRALANPEIEPGISEEDLKEAMRQEFRENEIFPKSDLTMDWLELLDYPAENVVSVKPVSQTKGEQMTRKSIV